MNAQNIQIVQGKVIIKQLTQQFASDLFSLLNSTPGEDASVLYQGPIHVILRSVGLLPHASKFVAYHIEDKIAIGFITLEENTKTNFTIKDVFVNPRYRNMGIASGLLNYVITLAKEKGVRKINLNVDPTHTNAIALYKKIGFREIGRTLLMQGALSGFSPSKVIKRVIMSQSYSRTLASGKESLLVKLQTNSKINRKILLDIYQRSVNQDWLDFFEINSNNLMNGSRHVWQPPLFKSALISDSEDSFALSFSQLFPFKDIVEFYRDPDAAILPVLEDLLMIIGSRGAGFAQFWLFGQTDDIPSKWFEKRKLMTFPFVGMGKTL